MIEAAARQPDPAPILEMRNISKTFPGVKALSNVNLTIYPGEVHALMGENGAGKSTLMKTLSGAYQADPGGEIRVGGVPLKASGPIEARAAGVSIIYQELALSPNLTVAENIYLNREPRRARPHRPRRHAEGLGRRAAAPRRELHARHAGRLAVHRRTADGRDRARGPRQFAHPRHGRAHDRAVVARVREAVRHRAPAPTRRPRHHLHLAPDGGGLRTVGPRLGAARRDLCRDDPAGRDDARDRGQDDGRARSVVLLQEEPPLPAQRRAGAGGARHRRRPARSRRVLRPAPGRGPGPRRPRRGRAHRDGPHALRRRSPHDG